jgi:ABC-type uncharacterized transport system permease subunit
MSGRKDTLTGPFAAACALVAAWIAFDVLVWAYGESPSHLLVLLFQGTWGTAYGVGQVLFKATPLLFAGVAVQFGLRAGLFNIGAEGQIMIGSLAVAAFASHVPHGLPSFVVLPIALLVAAGAGALWALLPAILRARYGAHEVISTIMMNRIAEAAVGLGFAYGLAAEGTVRTPDVHAAARIPRLDAILSAFHGSAASLALVLAAVVCVVVMWGGRHTLLGREIQLVAMNPDACRAERIPVRRRLAQALVISGAIAALAASSTVLGYKGYYERGLGAGAGFGGVAVALLGRASAVGLIMAALLFGTLAQGGLALNAHVPMEMMDVIQAVVIVAVALADVRIRALVAQSLKRDRVAQSVKGAGALPPAGQEIAQ